MDGSTISAGPEGDTAGHPRPGHPRPGHPGPGHAGPGEDDSFVVSALGLPWRLRLVGLDPELSATLRRIWRRATIDPASLQADAPAVTDFVVVPSREALAGDGIAPEHGVVVGTDVDAAPYVVSRALTLRSILRRRGEALMLHAVGVSAPDGRTVALVAPSGTGKTTAARTLGAHLGYVTDETVLVEADDRIRPHPKPLSVVVDPASPYDKHEWGPDDLDLVAAPDATHLAAIVVMRRDPDLAGPEFELLPLIDAMLAVIPETSALPSLPDPLARLAMAMCRSGGPFGLRYAEIADCVDIVTSLTRPDPERDAGAPKWRHVPGSVRELPPPTTADVAWDSVVTRTGWDDAIGCDGEMILLRDLVPNRLSRLGTTLWSLADDPTPVAELHARAVASIGAHPHSDALVLEALQVLVDAGVLQVVADTPADGD